LKDVGDVGLDRRFADVEPLADFGVGKAASDEPQDLLIALGEFAQLFRRRGPRDPHELLLSPVS
jgi:hypothetical protein